MIDLTGFKEVMTKNILLLVLLGAVLIAGNLLFRKWGRKLRGKRRR